MKAFPPYLLQIMGCVLYTSATYTHMYTVYDY